MKCDCMVGVWSGGEYIRLSELKTKLPVEDDSDWLWCLDQRRGYTETFCYCPYCGAKIDWKKIKKELKK